MEPKFQSSFIPKGPVATTGTATRISRESRASLLGTLALFIFVLSLILSVGVFGYERYLISHIGKMGTDLVAAKASLQPEVINAIARLDERIVSTGDLLNNHIVLSPLFDYLEASTLKSVRFNEFQYQTTEQGLTLMMRGQARGYAAVSLQAQIFNKSPYMKNPIFSDLDLDDKGNVTFSFKTQLDPSIVSYKKSVNSIPVTSVPVAPPVTAPAATSTPNQTVPVGTGQAPKTSTSTASTTKP